MDIIESLRSRMIEIAAEKGSFIAPEVLAISEQLDYFIVQIQGCPSTTRSCA